METEQLAQADGHIGVAGEVIVDLQGIAPVSYTHLIIMADEPTGALDSKTGRHVLEILHNLHEDGTTVILITHDNGIAATAERIVRISDGRIVGDGTREEVGL